MKKNRHVLAAVTLAVGLAMSLAACGSGESENDGEVVGSVDRGPQKEVRQAGDDLKVVALGWSDGEISLSLGVKPIAIYDWQGHGEKNKGVGPWASDKFGDSKVEIIKNTGKISNFEQIELLEPDVILNVRAANDKKVFDRLSEIAPVATAPTDAPDFAVDWRTQTEIIGKAIGKDSEATKAVEEADAAIKKVAEANPDFKGKTFVSGSKFGDAYGASVAGDARFDVFAEMGFVAYPPLKKLTPDGGFFASISAEQVPALDAQVAVLTTIGLPLSDLENDPLIKALDVVKDDRAVMVDEKDEINLALAAGTPQSIGIAADGFEPLLQKAVGNIK